ncbi:MAG: hypothetical protein VX527_10470 [Planctomycetota bacterium]|nr:hypothetical protein [Planctomycetota bacterium]
MITTLKRHGLTTGSFAAVLAILIAAGLVVALSLNAGKGTNVPRAVNQSGAQTPSEVRPPAALVPAQAASTPTLPSVPDIPDEEKPEAQVRVTPATLQLGYVEPGDSKTATF